MAENKKNTKPSRPRRRSSRSRPKWETIGLEDVPAEHQVLSHDDKDDRTDLSQHLVRGKRFRGSYMMGTNGGTIR